MNLTLLFSALILGQKTAPIAPKLSIPDASWPSIFFGIDSDAQTIRGRGKVSKLEDLQRKVLPPGVTEIRVWEGFGITYLEGYRFRQEAGKWRAWWIQPMIPTRTEWKAKNYLLELTEPAQGWAAFWKSLVANGIKDLPDFESLPGRKADVLDGISIVVEFASKGAYRTYMYDNPFRQPDNWPELAKVRAIVRELHNAWRNQIKR